MLSFKQKQGVLNFINVPYLDGDRTGRVIDRVVQPGLGSVIFMSASEIVKLMSASDIAKLIIEVEEAVNPESGYYGELVTWWEQDGNLCHYGIGLSNTHLFNLGTADAKDMSVLKRHDIIEQGNLDIRVISNIRSPFEEDEIIERLKYALRWLNDLPKDSSNQSISGRALVGLIFKDNEKWKHQGNEPIHNEIDYKSYLKRQSPSGTGIV